MEPTNRHPLECITSQSGLSMLECLIPFVDYPLKLPLALFIKFNEIRMIMNAFHSFDSLSSFGLNMSSNSPTDMLCALTGISPEILNTIMSMNSSMGSYPFSSGSPPNEPCTNFTPNSPDIDHFNHSIADIFAQYDMDQAASFFEESKQ